jgi:hypothetical protein
VKRAKRHTLASGAALGLSSRGGARLRVDVIDTPRGPNAELVRVDSLGRRCGRGFALNAAELLGVSDLTLIAVARALRARSAR